MTAPRVAVIGAGPSGLGALRSLRDAGLDPVAFEQSGRVGGNWVYSPEPGHSSVSETTHLISSKRLSQYRDFPMPSDYPDYPSHRQLLAYFEAYARHFDLIRSIRFETAVRRATKLPGERWLLELAGGGREEFDHLLVANGHHWDPRWPDYPGRFEGEYLHSHGFKRAEPFRGRRVLVIGGGNSACDIAVETGRVAAWTGLSWRRGYDLLPKLMFGQPPDVLNARMQWIPAPLRRRLQWLSWRVLTGGNAPYGLPEPDHDIVRSHPVLNSELPYSLRHGSVHPYPAVTAFDGPRVRFADGRVEPFDVVIAATGFRISFPFFDPGLLAFDDDRVPLYLRVFSPEHPTLYFIGLVQPSGSIWPLAEAQARLVAARINGRYRPPSDLATRAAADAETIRTRWVATPRHAIEVDYHHHLGELERALRS